MLDGANGLSLDTSLWLLRPGIIGGSVTGALLFAGFFNKKSE